MTLNRSAFDDLLAIRCVSQSDVARQAQLSPAHISEMASGIRGASANTARRLAQVLNVQPSTLFPELARFVAELEVA